MSQIEAYLGSLSPRPPSLPQNTLPYAGLFTYNPGYPQPNVGGFSAAGFFPDQSADTIGAGGGPTKLGSGAGGPYTSGSDIGQNIVAGTKSFESWTRQAGLYQDQGIYTPEWASQWHNYRNYGFLTGLAPFYAYGMYETSVRAGYISGPSGTPDMFTYQGRYQQASEMAQKYLLRPGGTPEEAGYNLAQGNLYLARAAYWQTQQSAAPMSLAWNAAKIMSYAAGNTGKIRAFGFPLYGALRQYSAAAAMSPFIRGAMAADPSWTTQKVVGPLGTATDQTSEMFGTFQLPEFWQSMMGSIGQWTLAQSGFWATTAGISSAMEAGGGVGNMIKAFGKGALGSIAGTFGVNLIQGGFGLFMEAEYTKKAWNEAGIKVTPGMESEYQLRRNIGLGTMALGAVGWGANRLYNRFKGYTPENYYRLPSGLDLSASEMSAKSWTNAYTDLGRLPESWYKIRAGGDLTAQLMYGQPEPLKSVSWQPSRGMTVTRTGFYDDAMGWVDVRSTGGPKVTVNDMGPMTPYSEMKPYTYDATFMSGKTFFPSAMEEDYFNAMHMPGIKLSKLGNLANVGVGMAGFFAGQAWVGGFEVPSRGGTGTVKWPGVGPLMYQGITGVAPSKQSPLVPIVSGVAGGFTGQFTAQLAFRQALQKVGPEGLGILGAEVGSETALGVGLGIAGSVLAGVGVAIFAAQITDMSIKAQMAVDPSFNEYVLQRVKGLKAAGIYNTFGIAEDYEKKALYNKAINEFYKTGSPAALPPEIRSNLIYFGGPLLPQWNPTTVTTAVPVSSGGYNTNYLGIPSGSYIGLEGNQPTGYVTKTTSGYTLTSPPWLEGGSYMSLAKTFGYEAQKAMQIAGQIYGAELDAYFGSGNAYDIQNVTKFSSAWDKYQAGVIGRQAFEGLRAGFWAGRMTYMERYTAYSKTPLFATRQKIQKAGLGGTIIGRPGAILQIAYGDEDNPDYGQGWSPSMAWGKGAQPLAGTFGNIIRGGPTIETEGTKYRLTQDMSMTGKGAGPLQGTYGNITTGGPTIETEASVYRMTTGMTDAASNTTAKLALYGYFSGQMAPDQVTHQLQAAGFIEGTNFKWENGVLMIMTKDGWQAVNKGGQAYPKSEAYALTDSSGKPTGGYMFPSGNVYKPEAGFSFSGGGSLIRTPGGKAFYWGGIPAGGSQTLQDGTVVTRNEDGSISIYDPKTGKTTSAATQTSKFKPFGEGSVFGTKIGTNKYTDIYGTKVWDVATQAFHYTGEGPEFDSSSRSGESSTYNPTTGKREVTGHWVYENGHWVFKKSEKEEGAAKGFEGITTRPTTIHTSEYGQPEQVSVTPLPYGATKWPSYMIYQPIEEYSGSENSPVGSLINLREGKSPTFGPAEMAKLTPQMQRVFIQMLAKMIDKGQILTSPNHWDSITKMAAANVLWPYTSIKMYDETSR